MGAALAGVRGATPPAVGDRDPGSGREGPGRGAEDQTVRGKSSHLPSDLTLDRKNTYC